MMNLDYSLWGLATTLCEQFPFNQFLMTTHQKAINQRGLEIDVIKDIEFDDFISNEISTLSFTWYVVIHQNSGPIKLTQSV